eukprot:673906-Rhodomonas_salina.2
MFAESTNSNTRVPGYPGTRYNAKGVTWLQHIMYQPTRVSNIPTDVVRFSVTKVSAAVVQVL